MQSFNKGEVIKIAIFKILVTFEYSSEPNIMINIL